MFDLVLQAVGRIPNGKKCGADKAGAAFSDPEVAWVGLTETEAEAKAHGIKVKKGLVPVDGIWPRHCQWPL